MHKIILSGFRKSLLCYQSWGPYWHFKCLLIHYQTFYDSNQSRHEKAGRVGFTEILLFHDKFFFQKFFPGPWLSNHFSMEEQKPLMLKRSQVRVCPEKPCTLRKTFVQVFIQITMCLQRLMFSSWNVSSIINVYKFYLHVCF